MVGLGGVLPLAVCADGSHDHRQGAVKQSSHQRHQSAERGEGRIRRWDRRIAHPMHRLHAAHRVHPIRRTRPSHRTHRTRRTHQVAALMSAVVAHLGILAPAAVGRRASGAPGGDVLITAAVAPWMNVRNTCLSVGGCSKQWAALVSAIGVAWPMCVSGLAKPRALRGFSIAANGCVRAATRKVMVARMAAQIWRRGANCSLPQSAPRKSAAQGVCAGYCVVN